MPQTPVSTQPSTQPSMAASAPITSTPGLAMARVNQTQYIKQVPINFRKFDSKEESLSASFHQAEAISRHPVTNAAADDAVIQVAITNIDWFIPDNTAGWIVVEESVKECKDWEDFKKIFTEGICERAPRGVFFLDSTLG